MEMIELLSSTRAGPAPRHVATWLHATYWVGGGGWSVNNGLDWNQSQCCHRAACSFHRGAVESVSPKTVSFVVKMMRKHTKKQKKVVRLCVSIVANIYRHIYIYLCFYMFIHIYIYIYIYAYMYSMYVYIYIYVYMLYVCIYLDR